MTKITLAQVFNLEERKVSTHKPRIVERLYPDALIVKRGKYLMSILMRFSCGCTTQERASGMEIRAGCSKHGDTVRYSCRVNSCMMSFAMKKDLNAHKWSHGN